MLQHLKFFKNSQTAGAVQTENKGNVQQPLKNTYAVDSEGQTKRKCKSSAYRVSFGYK